MGVASSMNLNQEDPLAPVNRRISIVVLNQRAQAAIEKANAATAPGGLAKPVASSSAAAAAAAGRS